LFWPADHCSLMGRRDETAVFEEAARAAQRSRLLAEGYDPRAGRPVDDVPQPFGPVPLINTARNLSTAGGPSHQREKTTEAGQQSAEQR